MSVDHEADIVFESGSALHRSCVQWKIRHFSAFKSELKAKAIAERELESPIYSTNSGNEWVLSINFTESMDILFFIHMESFKEGNSLYSPGMHTELSLIVDGVKHEIQQKTSVKCSMKSSVKYSVKFCRYCSIKSITKSSVESSVKLSVKSTMKSSVKYSVKSSAISGVKSTK